MILEYVSEHGSIGNSEARELLGLAESTVKHLLTDMAKREILKMMVNERADVTI